MIFGGTQRWEPPEAWMAFLERMRRVGGDTELAEFCAYDENFAQVSEPMLCEVGFNFATNTMVIGNPTDTIYIDRATTIHGIFIAFDIGRCYLSSDPPTAMMTGGTFTLGPLPKYELAPCAPEE